MNSKNPSIRVVGQRSIPSSFVFRASNLSKSIQQDVQIEAPNNKTRVSLSDFLDRKLNKNSLSLPLKTVQRKPRPFSSLVSRGDVNGSIHGQIGVKEGGEAEVNSVLDEVVFKQFKHTRKEKEDCISSCTVETGSSSRDDMQESKKRRNPFEDVDKKSTPRKHLVILGDDPKPEQKLKEESFIGNKKPKPLYNHYANGSGWWDYNMEGVDNEEVGCNEVWEGMGSTTLGGLEWH